MIGLNLGAGSDILPNRWKGIDTLNGTILNKNSTLPYNDIQYIYSSHFFEHIDDETAIQLLKESYRVLKKGGIIRLTTPHYERMFNKYKQNDINWWKTCGNWRHRNQWKEQNIKNTIANTLIHYNCNYFNGKISKNGTLLYSIPIINEDIIEQKVNELDVGSFCNWCLSQCPDKPISDERMKVLNKKYKLKFVGNGKSHINWWTLDKFKNILENIGFTNIKETYSTESSIPGNQFIAERISFRGNGSLWVEASK